MTADVSPDTGQQGHTAIKARPRPGAYLLENISQVADYWLKAGREYENSGEAFLAAENCANMWKNAAYDFAEKLHFSGYLHQGQRPSIEPIDPQALYCSLYGDELERHYLGHQEYADDAKEKAHLFALQGVVTAITQLSHALPPTQKKLWLWKNFVDGRPEYWAFDNPYPTFGGGDPQVIGEPCGYAIFKESTLSPRHAVFSEAEVIAAIKRARPAQPSAIVAPSHGIDKEDWLLASSWSAEEEIKEPSSHADYSHNSAIRFARIVERIYEATMDGTAKEPK